MLSSCLLNGDSMNDFIFVFGSNLSGVHGAGAARTALKEHGAVTGVPFGRTGNSYAIPTKNKTIEYTLHLDVIKSYVEAFIEYAQEHPELKFKVTRIGCGLAGLQDADIAPMFKAAPMNCYFDTAWEPWLGKREYWGTH